MNPPTERDNGHESMHKIGRYNILEQIGKGGMGIVYRAHDSVLERDVALKTHTVGADPDVESIERFFREARVAASFKHENIVTVFDLGQDGDKVFIVMELLEGQDLTHVLTGGRHISLEEKLGVVESVAKGLAHAHDRGIVHRDIKPRNVFLEDDGTVKLLDFGLAHIAYSTLTQVGQIIGTPFYMSPEQVAGKKATARSDIFSLGSLFYELLTGVRAFDRPNLEQIFDSIMEVNPTPIRELDPTLPEELGRIVSKMMAKSPDRRYAKVDFVLRDLTRFRSFLEQYKRQLRKEASGTLRELASLARHNARVVERHHFSIPPADLTETVKHNDLSYMSLVGLRDGASLQLRRLEHLIDDLGDSTDDSDTTLTMYEPPIRPAGDAREMRRRVATAEEKFRSAHKHYTAGDLAAGLRLVCDALRLDPNHPGAVVLSEKVRTSIMRLVDVITERDNEPKHFDVLVAALLAIGEPGGEGNILHGDSSYGQRDIAGLSDFFLSGLPKGKAEPEL